MPTLRYWTGSSWELLSLGGGGGGGATIISVSSDPGNASRLGTDGKVFTPLISPAAVAPLVGGAVGQVGVSTDYSRADHAHPFPTPAQIGASAVGHTHPAGQVSGLSTVATTGSYNDLTSKPTIPAAYVLPAASTTVLGGVKQGANITIAGDGTISAAAAGAAAKLDDLTDVVVTAPAIGQTIRHNGANFVNAKLDYADLTGAPAAYTLPVASDTVVGGVKRGSNVAIAADGTISVSPISSAAATTIPLADGNVGVVGTATTFARADHVHPRPTQAIRQINQAAYTLQAADTGNVVWSVFPTSDTVITLPTDAAAAIPVGSAVYILADAGARRTTIQPSTGVSLFWQDKDGTGALIKAGGSGPTFTTFPVGLLTLTQVVKVSANTWFHFTN